MGSSPLESLKKKNTRAKLGSSTKTKGRRIKKEKTVSEQFEENKIGLEMGLPSDKGEPSVRQEIKKESKAQPKQKYMSFVRKGNNL